MQKLEYLCLLYQYHKEKPMDETVYLDGIVGWDIVPQGVNETLAKATGSIAFELNSGGGYITDGVAIVNSIRNYTKGKTVANVSFAASMMTQIALACDEVAIYDNGIFMIHNAQGAVYGDHNDLIAQADLQKRMSDMLADQYVKKTGMTLEAVQALMDAETYYFGQEAVDAGFADMLIVTDCTKTKTSAIAEFKLMLDKGLEARKEEGLSAAMLKRSLDSCSGASCTVATGASPTVTIDNKSKINQGAEMAATDSFLGKLQARLGINVGKTDDQTLSELEETLVASNSALEVANTALATKTEAMDALSMKLAEADTFKAEIGIRLLEAKQSGVSMDVAIAMVNATSSEEASQLAIQSKQSNGGTPQGENQPNLENEEIEFAMNLAKKMSVGGK